MEPVIFLDIDGVLNRKPRTIGCPIIEPGPARNLQTLIAHTGARLVIISSWRKWLIDGLMDSNGLSLLLQTHGIATDVIGFLPKRTMTPPVKAEAIRQWLKMRQRIDSHLGMGPSPRFVVLDDQPLEIDNLVQTDPTQGLTCDDVVKAYRILREASGGASGFCSAGEVCRSEEEATINSVRIERGLEPVVGGEYFSRGPSK